MKKRKQLIATTIRVMRYRYIKNYGRKNRIITQLLYGFAHSCYAIIYYPTNLDCQKTFYQILFLGEELCETEYCLISLCPFVEPICYFRCLCKS